ncbi:hypothetical protein MPER_08067 [Moniliophthora perniciosa FA553]|nr:hypothetical protein MPER_08067 [Moniliophthora perniciosa FA553]
MFIEFRKKDDWREQLDALAKSFHFDNCVKRDELNGILQHSAALSDNSLCPGYKFVQEFGPDEEYEEEEEEVFYVTMELGNIEPTLVPSSDSIRLIGLDTPTPFLQLAGTIFKGSHDLLLGSELLFTEKKGHFIAIYIELS